MNKPTQNAIKAANAWAVVVDGITMTTVATRDLARTEAKSYKANGFKVEVVKVNHNADAAEAPAPVDAPEAVAPTVAPEATAPEAMAPAPAPEAAPVDAPEAVAPEADTLPVVDTSVVKPVLLRKSEILHPVHTVWNMAAEMVGARRQDVIQACVDRGIAFYTARTQYQAWFKKHGSPAAKAEAVVETAVEAVVEGALEAAPVP